MKVHHITGILYRKECMSVYNAKCVHKLKGHFLRLKVDKIWCEDGVVARLMPIFLNFFLKIISAEIVRI